MSDDGGSEVLARSAEVDEIQPRFELHLAEQLGDAQRIQQPVVEIAAPNREFDRDASIPQVLQAGSNKEVMEE